MNLLEMFEKKEQSKTTPKVSLDTVTVAEIHDDFNTASEKLYNEAIAIIEATKIANPERVEKLTKLGFIGMREVTAATTLLAQKEFNQKLADLILYYKNKYPFNKFITKDKFEEVCKKYDLYYSLVSAYIGHVPDDKLELMSKFKISEEDYRYFMMGIGMSSWQTDISYEDYIRYTADPIYISATYQYIKNTSLIIAAPKEDFNLGTNKEIVGREIRIKVVDPVVVHPVNGGYLIVAAWGEEANDPNVVNETNN